MIQVKCTFLAQEWIGDTAYPVLRENPPTWIANVETLPPPNSCESDDLRFAGESPQWVRDWSGPFEIDFEEVTSPFEVDLEEAHQSISKGARPADCLYMDLIQDVLDGKEWNTETLDIIATIVRESGRCVDDLEQGRLLDPEDIPGLVS